MANGIFDRSSKLFARIAYLEKARIFFRFITGQLTAGADDEPPTRLPMAILQCSRYGFGRTIPNMAYRIEIPQQD